MLAKAQEHNGLSKEEAERKVEQLLDSTLPQQRSRKDFLTRLDYEARIYGLHVKSFSYCYISPYI